MRRSGHQALPLDAPRCQLLLVLQRCNSAATPLGRRAPPLRVPPILRGGRRRGQNILLFWPWLHTSPRACCDSPRAGRALLTKKRTSDSQKPVVYPATLLGRGYRCRCRKDSYFKPLGIVIVTRALRAASFVLRAALETEFRGALPGWCSSPCRVAGHKSPEGQQPLHLQA